MKMINTSFAVLKTVGTISQAIIMAAFLTVILAADALASIPSRWILN